MQISAQQIATLLNGQVEGDSSVLVNRPCKIEEGGKGTITFLANTKYESYIYQTTASVVLVHQDFEATQAIPATLIRVADVYGAVAILLEKFGDQVKKTGKKSPQSFIDQSVQLPDDVSVGHFSVIEEGVSVGGGTVIFSQVFVGKNTKIGKNVILYPGVKIYHNCEIGDNCILHSNVIIGSDGFGFAPMEDGTYRKIAQIGNVILEADVEVGSNTVIDRATMGSTVIHKGVKLDNLIQIAHNVEIGENTVIAAQAGIAGSTKIGENCRIGGQAGFVGHIQVADGVMVQAQSGVAGSIKKPGTAVYGSPAIAYADYLRAYAVFKKLPDVYRKINQLEKK